MNFCYGIGHEGGIWNQSVADFDGMTRSVLANKGANHLKTNTVFETEVY